MRRHTNRQIHHRDITEHHFVLTLSFTTYMYIDADNPRELKLSRNSENIPANQSKLKLFVILENAMCSCLVIKRKLISDRTIFT